MSSKSDNPFFNIVSFQESWLRSFDSVTGLPRQELRGVLESLGDEAAAHFRRVLPEALDTADHIVVLTHVPPFREASWYRGQCCDPDWLPFFACKAAGDVLCEFRRQYPNKRMTVLCGHTHGGGTSHILPNLIAITGPAQYGRPAVQNVFNWT